MHPASLAAIAVIVLATAYGFVRKAPLSLMFAVAILVVYALQVATSAFGFALAPLFGLQIRASFGDGAMWVGFAAVGVLAAATGALAVRGHGAETAAVAVD